MAAVGLNEGVVKALSFQPGEEEVSETVGGHVVGEPGFMGVAGQQSPHTPGGVRLFPARLELQRSRYRPAPRGPTPVALASSPLGVPRITGGGTSHREETLKPSVYRVVDGQQWPETAYSADTETKGGISDSPYFAPGDTLRSRGPTLLHRVVALESALPLFLVATVSIVVGLGSAALYLHSQVGITFSIPGIGYWATVVGGLAASLAVIASTFPLLDRTTGPEVARNE